MSSRSSRSLVTTAASALTWATKPSARQAVCRGATADTPDRSIRVPQPYRTSTRPYFNTDRERNGGTKVSNSLIDLHRRIA